MPLLSSPLTYPPSPSPRVVLEKRKRNQYPDQQCEPKRRHVSSGNLPPEGPPLFRKVHLNSAKTQTSATASPVKTRVISKGPFVDDEEEDEDKDASRQNSMHGVLENAPALKATAIDGNDDISSLDIFDRIPASGEINPKVQNASSPKEPLKSVPRVRTSSGKTFRTNTKKSQGSISYEQLIAARSTAAQGRAAKSFYGIDIHDLLDQAGKEPRPVKSKPTRETETTLPSVEHHIPSRSSKKGRTLLWTEKYRARKFTDLVGDERTHRDVLRWIKGWDPIVFPGSNKPKPKTHFGNNEHEPKQHRKVLLLTGPPGLGKTTLAHVCARQAGYEIVEINASDERSRDVVKGRIRDCVGTENVKGINMKEAGGVTRKAGRPVCVVVDEVDGVVGGSSSGGEGGFIKALIDLAMLDQKNTNILGATSGNAIKSKKNGDWFRLLRPMILICNDVYHPALRPLRSSTMAEIIHVRKPPLDKVVTRLISVFDKEGVACDGDGVRRLCEATWGISNRRESRNSSTGTGEGDMRGILVVGEWAAAKMRASLTKNSRLTKKWVEENMIENLSHGGGGARGMGRGGAKEAVDRVFLDGAGFPKAASAQPTEDFGKIRDGDTVGVAELAKRAAMDRLREMVDISGESDRIMTDCFASYPTHSWQDDTFLSKPNAAYEWLHFHDRVSSRVHVGQEWELGPYLSQSVLGFHHLFASPAKHSWTGDHKRWDDNEDEEPLPFSGPRADYSASEALKQNKAILQGLQSSLSIPLHRSFKSVEDISTDLIPHLVRLLTPDVKPIVVGGSGEQRGIVGVRKEGEREMIQHAVGVMGTVGVTFERARVESGQNGLSTYIYRMEP